MKILDMSGVQITDPDLSAGELICSRVIRPDAEPVDGVVKHAWADEDYEEVMVYHPYTPEELAAIEAEKNKLTQEERITTLEEENRQLKEALDLLLSGETQEEVSADG